MIKRLEDSIGSEAQPLRVPDLARARMAPTPPLGNPVAQGPTLVKVRSYEQLDDGQGRQVFFRPQRYQRSDLNPMRAILHITTAQDASFDCELIDVSQNGVAFE